MNILLGLCLVSSLCIQVALCQGGFVLIVVELDYGSPILDLGHWKWSL